MTETADPRSLDQNSALWPMLHDISEQVDWPVMQDGVLQVRKLDAEAWKNILTAGLEKTQRMAQGIDGGWVLLGQSTRKMSKARFSKLLDLCKLFGDSKGVTWSAPAEYQAMIG